MWPFGVGGGQSQGWAYGRRGPADSGCALCWGRLLKGTRGAGLSLSVVRTETRAEQSAVLFQTFDSPVLCGLLCREQLQRRPWALGFWQPHRKACRAFCGDLPSRSSLCPAPTHCLLGTPWEPASLVFPGLCECRCAAGLCPCSAGAWPACLQPGVRAPPVSCLSSAGVRRGVCVGRTSSWGRAAACPVRRATWCHPGPR